MTNILRQYPGTLESAIRDPGWIVPGNRLLLRDGTYHITSDLLVALNGVTITNYPGETPILLSEGGLNVFFLGSQCHTLTIDGLTLDGSGGASSDGMKITDGCHDIIVQNCIIQNFAGNGILITRGNGETKDIEIASNTITDNGAGDPFNHGIYCSVDGMSIHGNTITNNAGMGLHAFDGEATDIGEAYNNYFGNNTRFGIGLFYGLWTIWNNVSRGNGDFALSIKYGAMNTNAYFNTLIGSVGVEEIYATGVTITLKNNTMGGTHGLLVNTLGNNTLNVDNCLMDGTSEDESYYPDNTGVTKTNCLVGSEFSPVSDNGTYSVLPTAGNPVIGAGVAVAGITTDYGGNARPNPPTIGAWE